MTKKWELTRNTAEMLVDHFESIPEDQQRTGYSYLTPGTFAELADELRELFGMRERAKNSQTNA
jgi:hypothetical protein